MEEVNEQEIGDEANTIKNQVNEDHSGEEQVERGNNEENQMHSPILKEGEIVKKYGHMLTKKKPLISKDHERAFFDSADWEIGKQGAQKARGPLHQALRPKLQPTPYHQTCSRRTAYAPKEDGEDGHGPFSLGMEDGKDITNVEDDNSIFPNDNEQSCHEK